MDRINEEYDTFVRSHPEEMKDAILFLEKEMERRNCKFGDMRVPTFLKPVFLETDQVTNIKGVVDHVISILDKLSRLYFDDPKLREFFYIDEKAHELLEIDHGYSRNIVIARPDSFLVNGNMRFVEFNCDSPAGIGYCDLEEEIFRETYPMRSFEKQYNFLKTSRKECLLKALLSAYEEFAGKNKRPNIAILDWREVRTVNEFHILSDFFKSKGYDTVVADPRDLKYRDGTLYCDEFPIDLVYRRTIFKELMAELDNVQGFIQAYKDGKVCVVNPLRSRLAANKALLAILTNQKEFKHLFSDEENQIINKHIPWTRRVLDMQTHFEGNPVFLKKHIINHKNTLVLKPADSYGGKDVMIGNECAPEDWKVLLNHIFSEKEDWVVQKYVDITTMTVPKVEDGKLTVETKKFNLNPFILGGHYSGCMARLSDQSVINVSAGGGMVPVVEYRER